MKVTFWGTRGFVSKAGKETLKFGGHTCCVHIVTNSGIHLILDCGTGARDLGTHLVQEGTAVGAHVLITHTHWDHIQGLPFFSPLFIPDNNVHIYGPHGLRTGLHDAFRGQMQSKDFPLTLDACGARIEYHELAEETFTIGDVTVTTQLMNHNVVTLGYRIEADGATVVYCTDHEPHDRALAAGGTPERASADDRHCGFLSEADLVIHDCPYVAAEYPSKAGCGHSTVEYVVDMALHAQVHEVALFHHSPLRSDGEVDALVAAGQGRVRQHIARLLGERGLPVPHKLRVTGAMERHSMWLGKCRKEWGVPKSTWLSLEDAEGYMDKVREGVIKRKKPKGSSVSTKPARNRVPSAEGEGAEELHFFQRGDSSLLLVVYVTEGPMRECIREAVEGDARIRPYFAESLEDFHLLLDKKKPPLVLLGRALNGRPDEGLSLCSRVGERLPNTVCMVACEDGQRARWHPDVADWLQWPFTTRYAHVRIMAMLLRHQSKWLAADRCHDEERRLVALRDLKILDTAPDPRFDAVTTMCVMAFKVSHALVSLVDADRQWFKSKAGKIACSQTSRDESFCAHAILQDGIFEVPDTTMDPRFAENPLVTGELRIRFYAGVPLATRAGHKIGTLCILDDRPKKLTASEVGTLKQIALLVTELILTVRARQFAVAVASGAATESQVVEQQRALGQRRLSFKWPPPKPVTPKAAPPSGKGSVPWTSDPYGKARQPSVACCVQ
eukprot:jgi/Mesvir1/4329/Mv18580-RA.1